MWPTTILNHLTGNTRAAKSLTVQYSAISNHSSRIRGGETLGETRGYIFLDVEETVTCFCR